MDHDNNFHVSGIYSKSIRLRTNIYKFFLCLHRYCSNTGRNYIRLIAVFSLGKMFTVDVTIRKDHALKKNGIYKFLRHPSYAGSLLSFIGFGLSLNNWVSLLIVFIAILSVFLLRINIEEKLLLQQFGKEYVDYKKKTAALIPFIL